MGIADRVVSIFDRARKSFTVPPNVPAPPPYDREIWKAGGYALFMDEHEATILYAKPLEGPGVPNDERTNSSMWNIDGSFFGPSRRDEFGNWIFRRTAL